MINLQFFDIEKLITFRNSIHFSNMSQGLLFSGLTHLLCDSKLIADEKKTILFTSFVLFIRPSAEKFLE